MFFKISTQIFYKMVENPGTCPGSIRRTVVKKKRIIRIGIAAALVIVAFLGFRAYSRYRVMKTMQESRGQVETVRVTKQNLIDSISVTGTIASADARDVSASAQNVEVLQVNYEVGDYVNAGDVIVVLDTTDLELSLTEAQNNQALSEYKENKSIESAAENYTEAVEDGTDDYAKAVKAEAEAKEALQDAESDLSSAASALKRQEERLGDAKAAYEAASDEDKDALKKAYDEAQQEYTSRHQAYNAAAEAEEKAVDAYETASENLADAQTKNDRNISNAADNLEQAQMEHTYSNDSSQQIIENYQEQIDSCTVTAPISGVITAMNVAVGDTYQGNTLFSIADNENFIVTASVDEYDIGSIAKDMTAAVIVEALGDDELPATVSFVSPSVSNSNMGSSSYSIEIALDDPNTDLRIGMTAKASIVLDAAYDVLTVPYDCVTTDEEGNSTITIDDNGEQKVISVTVGMEGDYYVEVSGDELTEDTFVYYSTAMANNAASGSDSDDDSSMMMMPGMGGGNGGGNGGGMGGGGGNPGGGGGAPGGF
jgi:multidrug efflux pump subunit AcrA (membrane-fusion protein)